MPKISVIMPCLNMEKYISESIESVLNQTLEDIEILVIDAGSTEYIDCGWEYWRFVKRSLVHFCNKVQRSI